MVRLAGQMKNALTLFSSLGSSIAFGFASRRFDQPGGLWRLPAAIGAGCFLVQLGLVFLKSKEDIELEQFKRLQSAENERNLAAIEGQKKIAIAVADRVVKEIASGTVEEAEKWRNFQGESHGR